MKAPFILTLTTDFGTEDHYLACLKGMLADIATLKSIDISHHIKPYNIVQASYLLGNSWAIFPRGTIHLVSVNDYFAKGIRLVALSYKGHYFIGPDNGIFSLLFPGISKEVVTLPFDNRKQFPVISTYAQAIRQLVKGSSIEELGEMEGPLSERLTLRPVNTGDQIRGSILHVDHYDNAITNIDKALFDQVGRARPFALFFKRHDPITQLSQTYHDVEIGEPLCRFNSSGLLEMAINMGRAATLLSLQVEDTIQIDFKPEENVGTSS